jgi:hypothetical protein
MKVKTILGVLFCLLGLTILVVAIVNKARDPNLAHPSSLFVSRIVTGLLSSTCFIIGILLLRRKPPIH